VLVVAVVVVGFGRDSLASVDTGVVGRGGASAWAADKLALVTGGLVTGVGASAVELATEVETEEVVRCKADDRAAEREATEPITDEREVVGGVEEEYPGRLYKCGYKELELDTDGGD